MSNFKFPRPSGFAPTARQQQVSRLQSSVPGFAQGGMVRRNSALVDRSEPVTELDREGGGRTPLRPGYSKGGKAKKKCYAEGGKVGKLREVAGGFKGYKPWEITPKGEAPRRRPDESVSDYNKRTSQVKKYAEGGKVGKLKKVADFTKMPEGRANLHRERSETSKSNRRAASQRTAFGTPSNSKPSFAEGGKVGALGAAMKRMPAVAGARKMAADDMRSMRKSNPDAAKDAARMVKSSRRAQGRTYAEGGKVSRLRRGAEMLRAKKKAQGKLTGQVYEIEQFVPTKKGEKSKLFYTRADDISQAADNFDADQPFNLKTGTPKFDREVVGPSLWDNEGKSTSSNKRLKSWKDNISSGKIRERKNFSSGGKAGK